MKNLLRLAIFVTFLVALPMYALESAEQRREGSAEAEHEESPFNIAFKWVNFAILFGGLGYLLRKPAKEFFDSRKADIATGIERAKLAQSESEDRMKQIEQRLAQLSKEVANLRSESEQEAITERGKIVAEAQREVDRVVEQSRQEMERIAHGIEREIKENVADVVIERAAQKLQTKMTADDQKRVVVRFIKNL